MKDTVLLGFSQADITPEKPVQMIGFGRSDELSRGVMSPLAAGISVWQSGGGTCAVIAIDHIGFSLAHADELRTNVAELLGTSQERVMLCFSHTHSAPNDSAEEAYFNFLKTRVLAGVKKALENMVPVLAAWGNADADIGVNRRQNAGELDRRIGILKVTDARTGRLTLLMLRLTAHANVLKADNYLISPDYFGTVRNMLAEKYGCAVVLTQGASGNVAPTYFTSNINPPDAADETRFVRSDSALTRMAKEITDALGTVIADIRPRPIQRLDMYSVRLTLNADVPTYEKARETAAEARREAGIDGTAWLAEVQKLNARNVTVQRETVELQYFALNEGCLCGVPNEIMCEFALRAVGKTRNPFFYLGGYTNGSGGYFPTEEEYDKGGYEVLWSMLHFFIYYGRVAPLNRDSAAVFIQTTADHAPPGAETDEF